MGVRIHALAKELGLESKMVMEFLEGRGVRVKGHMSSIKDDEAELVRIFLAPDPEPEPEPEPEPVPEPQEEAVEESAAVEEEPVAAAEEVSAVEEPEEISELPAEVAEPEPVVEAVQAEEAPVEEVAEIAEDLPVAEEDPIAEPAVESAPEEEPAVAEVPEPEAVAEPVSEPASSDEVESVETPESPVESPAETVAESPVEPVVEAAPEPPKKTPRKIVMAPGFGGDSGDQKTPIMPVARPLDPKAPTPRKSKGRPLIIRSKAPARPAGRTDSGPRRDRPAGGPGRGGPRTGGTSRPAAPSSAHGAKKVMVFPGAEAGGPPGAKRGGGPGRGGPGGKGRGRQQSRPRNQESDFTRRRLQQDLIPEDLPDQITLEEPASIKDLSLALGVKQTALLKKLMNQGMLANVNSPLSQEIVDTLSVEINCEIILEAPKAFETTLDEIESFEDAESDLILRAPVVTMMGHVDHGKTTLLDKIRESSITKSESGGITQHLSAYRVDKGNAHVVFVDTPGHRAFTSMRARGANVTDVVVLVVAADDGPMPQTEEAIEHAKAAEVPIVVAINKMDRPGANIDMVKAKLAELGLTPSDWGGDTEMIPVSAMTGEGVDGLLEHLSLESEILELKANPEKKAIGTVLDSRASTGEGNVITVLVQDGTLHQGDNVVCGPAHGKIRTLKSTSGHHLETAPPATPVEITGLNDLPEAGDKLYSLDSASKARQIAEERQEAKAKADRAERQKVTLEGLFDTIDKAKTKEINVIVKTDVKGTLDVLKSELSSMHTEEVAVRVLRGGVGEISESDILLADASNAIVIGFHVSASDKARSEAESHGVEIRTYTVIYEILEDMKQALEGMLSPDISEELQGSAEILHLFKSSKLGNIAGCMVRSGIITRDDKIRLIRDGVMVYEGKLASLKRVKDDAKEVREGFECGLVVKGYNDIKVGDFIESYKVIETSRKLGETNKSSG